MNQLILRRIILPISLLSSLLIPPTTDASGTLDQGRIQGPPSPAGFTAPADVGALLDYRLPSWGYHHLQMDFGFDALQTDTQGSKNLTFDLGSDYLTYHESEDWTWHLETNLQGGYNNQSVDHGARSTRNIQGRALLNGSATYYVAGDWAVTGQLSGDYDYRENRAIQDTSTTWRYDHRTRFNPGAGVAYGRIRDVTPLLRAQRISERLGALGRTPLTADEVQALAEIIARRSGYAVVFDRSDKAFWGDLLGRLAGDTPLTPYEVMYLTEVLVEELGSRFEGWKIKAGVGTRRTGGDLGDQADFVSGNVRCSHNLSLDHQLSVSGSWQRDWRDLRNEELIRLGLTHLWVLADRVTWTNSLTGYYEESEVEYENSEPIPNRTWRRRQAVLASQLKVYLEDSLVLTPTVSAEVFDTVRSPGSMSPEAGYRWMARITMTWYLDQALY